MYFKIITSTVFAASLAIIPAEQAEADAGDFIAGAIIGGIVGANAKKQRRTTRSTRSTRSRSTRKKRSTRSTLPSTQEGKNIQASLNYFGFDAGAVDGQLGRKTKNAVSQYQAYLGYPVTGQLSEFEKNLLTSSYNRAQAGGYAVQQQVAANVDGTRGLLKTYRAEMAGGVAPAQPTTTIVVAPQPVPQATQPTFAATAPAAGTLGATALAAAVAPEAPAALPNFLGAGTQASLASHCNQVSLITNTNGGFVSLATMTDPNVALNEQFCLARTYAIAKSEELASRIQGFTPDQIAAQCQGFGPAMKPHVASLSAKPRDAVVTDVAGFAQTTGMSPAQLQGTAKICLGVGYRTDNMDVALGSALLLYTMGEGVYGELMGHHLSQGFGPAKRADMAQSWYEAGLAAVDTGGAAVFNPGQPERTELIRQASQRVNGGGLPTLPLVQPASGSALPTFSISE